MLASLSPENKIESLLRALDCSGRSLLAIAQQSGTTVNSAAFSLAMSGQKNLRPEMARKLVDLLNEMQKLQDSVPVPINWTSSEKISTVLTIRRIASIAAESGDDSFDELALAATKSVAK